MLADIQVGAAQQAHRVVVLVAALHNSIHHWLRACVKRTSQLIQKPLVSSTSPRRLNGISKQSSCLLALMLSLSPCICGDLCP